VIDKLYPFPEIIFPPSVSLSAGQLVCIARDYEPISEGTYRVGPPLAVGRMTLPSASAKRGTKSKVLTLLHAWKDELWKMGGEGRPPRPRVFQGSPNTEEVNDEAAEAAPVRQRNGTRDKRTRKEYSSKKGGNKKGVEAAAVRQRNRARRRRIREENSKQGSYFQWISESCS